MQWLRHMCAKHTGEAIKHDHAQWTYAGWHHVAARLAIPVVPSAAIEAPRRSLGEAARRSPPRRGRASSRAIWRSFSKFAARKRALSASSRSRSLRMAPSWASKPAFSTCNKSTNFNRRSSFGEQAPMGLECKPPRLKRSLEGIGEVAPPQSFRLDATSGDAAWRVGRGEVPATSSAPARRRDSVPRTGDGLAEGLQAPSFSRGCRPSPGGEAAGAPKQRARLAEMSKGEGARSGGVLIGLNSMHGSAPWLRVRASELEQLELAVSMRKWHGLSCSVPAAVP